MNARSILSRLDHEEYLVRAFFGTQQNYMHACVQRAYLDVVQGSLELSVLPVRGAAQEQDIQIVQGALEDLRDGQSARPTADEFDTWHQALCAALVALYEQRAPGKLCLGHAQRWVNATFRYIFTLGELRVPGFTRLYPLCHITLEPDIIDRLESDGMPQLPCPWNRLDDYELYLQRQKWLRNHYEFAPLDIEFLLWLGQDLRSLTLP
jgi:hypothetical protein